MCRHEGLCSSDAPDLGLGHVSSRGSPGQSEIVFRQRNQLGTTTTITTTPALHTADHNAALQPTVCYVLSSRYLLANTLALSKNCIVPFTIYLLFNEKQQFSTHQLPIFELFKISTRAKPAPSWLPRKSVSRRGETILG